MSGAGVVIYHGTDAGVEELLRRGLAKLARPLPVVGLRGGLPR